MLFTSSSVVTVLLCILYHVKGQPTLETPSFHCCDGNLSLTCLQTGFTGADFVWKKDGVPIYNDGGETLGTGRYSETYNASSFTLVISGAISDDGGAFVCNYAFQDSNPVTLQLYCPPTDNGVSVTRNDEKNLVIDISHVYPNTATVSVTKDTISLPGTTGTPTANGDYFDIQWISNGIIDDGLHAYKITVVTRTTTTVIDKEAIFGTTTSSTTPEKENGGPNGGAIGGGVGGGVCGIVVITIVIIIIRRRMQAVDIEIMDPKGGKVKPTITSHKDGVYLVEFTPTLAGCYTIKISISGKAIPESPLSVIIGAAHASKAWYTSGLGIQQSGVRVNTKAKFKVHTKGDGDKVGFEVISPAGQNIKCEIKRSEKEVGVFECHYIPPVVGRYVIKIIDEQNITESTFEVDVRPEKTSKLGAYGLEEGVVNQLASFIVESGVIDDKDQTKSKKTEEQAGNDGGSSCFPRNNSILPICAGTDQQPQPSQGGQGQGGQHTAKGQTKLPPDHGRQKPDGDNGRPLPIPDKDDGLQKSKTEKSGSVVSKGDVEIDEALQVKPRKLPDIPPGGEKNNRGISANFDEVVLNKKRLTPVGKESIEIFEEESQGKKKKKKKKKKDKGKDTNVEEDTDL